MYGGVALGGEPLDVRALAHAALPLPHHARHLLLKRVALADLRDKESSSLMKIMSIGDRTRIPEEHH